MASFRPSSLSLKACFFTLMFSFTYVRRRTKDGSPLFYGLRFIAS